eukprot:gene277-1606_t
MLFPFRQNNPAGLHQILLPQPLPLPADYVIPTQIAARDINININVNVNPSGGYNPGCFFACSFDSLLGSLSSWLPGAITSPQLLPSLLRLPELATADQEQPPFSSTSSPNPPPAIVNRPQLLPSLLRSSELATTEQQQPPLSRSLTPNPPPAPVNLAEQWRYNLALSSRRVGAEIYADQLIPASSATSSRPAHDAPCEPGYGEPGNPLADATATAEEMGSHAQSAWPRVRGTDTFKADASATAKERKRHAQSAWPCDQDNGPPKIRSSRKALSTLLAMDPVPPLYGSVNVNVNPLVGAITEGVTEVVTPGVSAYLRSSVRNPCACRC